MSPFCMVIFLYKMGYKMWEVRGMCFLGETFLRKRFPQTPSKTFLIYVAVEDVGMMGRGKRKYSVEYG